MIKPRDHKAKIPDKNIWEVVCLWQSLRLLLDLYLDTAISGAYVTSRFSYSSDQNVLSNNESSALEENLPDPSLDAHSSAKTLASNERDCPYERFYIALTSQWLAAGMIL